MRAVKRRHLLDLQSLTPDEITLFLDTADSMKEILSRPIRKVPALSGKNFVLLFSEASTRTRASFETAGRILSANTSSVPYASSSFQKGESFVDAIRNLEAMGIDGLIIRHGFAGSPELAANVSNICIINAGDGSHEHPTQGLLDLMTVRERKQHLNGLNVLIIGDIAHSRVARSDIWGFTKLGATVTVVAPPTLIPRDIESTGAHVSHQLDPLLPHADVIQVLRIQKERQQSPLFPSVEEYRHFYGLTKERLGKLKPDCLIMHPGPMNRGVEIDSSVADSKQNVILDQVKNGIAMRMSVLFLLLGEAEQPLD